jgi:transposase
MSKTCPKCGLEMELIEDEPDVGIVGGWDCECGHTEHAEPADDYFPEEDRP